ncbi:MAG TPA: GNVR domain-containing protein [Candidatus Eremiobacteraceae bacterium]|nr:GNVR domain-containing protein [Candidatus Eremiobacteraceae bacterium]
MKQLVGIENSVQQLQEEEIPTPGNGTGGSLIEGVQGDGFEWAWLLWLNRRSLGRWMIGGLVFATVLAFLLPKKFESTTQLMPPDPKSGSGLSAMMMAAMSGPGGGGSALAGPGIGSIAGDLLGMKDPGAVFTEMLRSRTVKDRIIERFDLRKVYGVRYYKGAREQLAKYTSITLDRKSGVITITVTDRDPQRATQIAQAYVEELDRISAEVNTSAAHRERLFIEQRLKAVKQDLKKASEDFSEYASKNATLDIKEEGVAVVEAAAVLQGQLIAAQSELDGLEQIYTSSNVRVRSLQARVDELNRQLKKVGGSTTGADDPNSQQEFPSIRKLPLLGVQWADLYRENKIQETVYELLTEQYEMAKIEEAKETPVVKVLDVAVVPEKKSSPQRPLIMFLGVMLSLVAGCVWVLNNAKWQSMDPADPRKQLGLEIIATCGALWSKAKAQLQALGHRIGKKSSADLG